LIWGKDWVPNEQESPEYKEYYGEDE
jgi:hypothetical protein